MLTERGRRAGLALSGQTLSGLAEEVKTIAEQSCGVLCLIGANDVKRLAVEVLNDSVTQKAAENQLRAAMGNLLQLLCKTFSGKIVVCKTISCRGKRIDEDW